jgi:hypothetical protein
LDRSKRSWWKQIGRLLEGTSGPHGRCQKESGTSRRARELDALL